MTTRVNVGILAGCLAYAIALPAKAQLDPSCKVTGGGNTPEITTCNFPIGRTEVTWLFAPNPVPTKVALVTAGVHGNRDDVCYVPYQKAADGSDTDIPTYKPICVFGRVNGLATYQDTFAGFSGFYNGVMVTNEQETLGSQCTGGTSVGGGIPGPNPIKKSLSLVFPVGSSGGFGPPLSCIHHGVFTSWNGCSIGACPPPTGSAIYKWVVGSPPWSIPQRKEALKTAVDALGWVGIAAATLALKFPVFGNVGVAAGLAWAPAALGGAANLDPPDVDYTKLAGVTTPNIDTSSFPPAAAALFKPTAQVIGLSNALATTLNRATGAFIDGDMDSQQLQVGAMPGLEQQLDALDAQLPDALAAWGKELLSNGIDPRTVTLADVLAFQKSVTTSGLPKTLRDQLTALGADLDTISNISVLLSSADARRAASLLQNAFNYGPLGPPVLPASSNLPQLAAVLPTSRSVPSGTPATAFATIINTGAATAKSCGIAPSTDLAVSFEYQTTDPTTNALTGTLNTPVDIPAGASQSFVISVTPKQVFIPLYINFNFFCANANPAPQNAGLNTLLLSGAGGPVADIVALAASADPGIVNLPGQTGSGAFAVATVNVGTGTPITAVADTGDAILPVTITLCQTVPATGACMAAPAANVTTTINAGETPTFGIFVKGSDTVPFDPTNNRVFVRFNDSTNTLRGATSVAVRTQ